MYSASDLKNRLEFHHVGKSVNEYGETDYTSETVRKVWANVTPKGGGLKDLEGETDISTVTHRIVIRESSARNIKAGDYFIYKGQRLDITHFYPIYNRSGWMEVFCRLEVE